MGATETAEQTIVVDTTEEGTPQDALHIIRDGEVVFALDANGHIVVGSGAPREIGYDEVVAPVQILGSNLGQATVLIQCPERDFDGTQVAVDVFLPAVTLGNGTAPVATFALYEGDLCLGVLGEVSVNGRGFTALWRHLPSPGKHTFALRGWVAPRQGTPSVLCGPGGVGAKAYLPAFVRFSRG